MQWCGEDAESPWEAAREALKATATLGQEPVAWTDEQKAAPVQEIEELNLKNEKLLEALVFAKNALLQCKPCAEEECKADQQDWLDAAIDKCNAMGNV